MNVSYDSKGNLNLKTKTEPVVIGAGLQIGSRAIEGPGEYDIAAIQCEGHALHKGIAYFIRTEDLLVTYLTDVDDSAQKLDEVSDTDILVLDLRSDSAPEKVKSLIKAIEPAYVLAVGAG